MSYFRGILCFSAIISFFRRAGFEEFTDAFTHLYFMSILRRSNALLLRERKENGDESQSDASSIFFLKAFKPRLSSSLPLPSFRLTPQPSSKNHERKVFCSSALSSLLKYKKTYFVTLLLLLCFTIPILASAILNRTKKQTDNVVKPVHTRFFAQIPNYRGKPSKIVSMTSRNGDIYVCTSTSGGRIYKVDQSRNVVLWFDVAQAMFRSTGRRMSMNNRIHGGLRSMAFHPSFHKNGLFYTAAMEQRPNSTSGLEYFSTSSRSIPADSVVIEWRVDQQSQRIDYKSYRQVIRIGMPVYDHPIRGIMFVGNNMFISHGDGSVQSATAGGGQKNDGLGKILRINPLRQGNSPYTVPSDNPFLGNPNWKDELYAVGFRNPINMCMSKKRRVGLMVVDVGRDNFDEINLVRPGGNYGWSKREGTFVHKQDGGIITGVGPLPSDDAKYSFTYPAVQVGHYHNETGKRFVGQALTGSCPIENGSPLSDVMLYANFASNGELFYSRLDDMASARTSGPPSQLTQAQTIRPKIYFHHDNNKTTAPLQVRNLREIIRRDPGLGGEKRADVRFGRGSKGEIYWSSKRNGKIYLITSTVSGANV